ncbi:MAG: TolC family protein, partial [Verrucomicrobiota bacterium]
PETLPIALLDSRPDLEAAELRLRAANADIGVAVADLYPNVSLSGGIGFTSSIAEDLFDADRLSGSLVGSIVQRIFEGGALRANIRLQEAELEGLARNYASLVLTALQEVESALQGESKLREQLLRQGQSVRALKQAEELSRERYLDGLLSLQDFLDTQQRRYAAEQSWLLTHQTYWNNRVNLYLALGGEYAGGSVRQESRKKNS